jgi:hypothetical protein
MNAVQDERACDRRGDEECGNRGPPAEWPPDEAPLKRDFSHLVRYTRKPGDPPPGVTAVCLPS